MVGFIIVIVLALIGWFVGNDLIIPYAFSEYIAVAILAFLDSIFGGISANIQKKFNMKIFVTGFFGNALIAIFLVYLGDKLNVDIYLAAVIVFSGRLFNNFSIIRRSLLESAEEKKKKKTKEKNKVNKIK